MKIKTLLIFLLLALSAQAVEKLRTVKQNLGDYTTLESCMNANESDITAGAGTTFVASIEGTWSVDDNTFVSIDGWVTDATYFVTAVTDSDSRHDGKWKTTAYILYLNTSFGQCISNTEEYTVLEGLQVHSEATFQARQAIESTSSNITISHSIIRCSGAIANNAIESTSGTSGVKKVSNTLIYDCPGVGIYLWSADSAAFVYSNTVENCGTGAQTGNNDMIAKGNIIKGCPTPGTGSFDSASDYNASDSSTVFTDNTNDRTGVTFIFVDSTGNDFHLAAGDTAALNHGVDLSGDANLAVTDDIDGDSRPQGASTDIGIDERLVAAGVAPSPRRRKIPKVFGGYIDEKGDSITLVSAMVE